MASSFKGSLREGDSPQCGEMSAKQTEGTARPRPTQSGGGKCVMMDLAQILLYRALLPSFSCENATFLSEEGFCLVPFKRVCVTSAWLTGP